MLMQNFLTRAYSLSANQFYLCFSMIIDSSFKMYSVAKTTPNCRIAAIVGLILAQARCFVKLVARPVGCQSHGVLIYFCLCFGGKI